MRSCKSASSSCPAYRSSATQAAEAPPALRRLQPAGACPAPISAPRRPRAPRHLPPSPRRRRRRVLVVVMWMVVRMAVNRGGVGCGGLREERAPASDCAYTVRRHRECASHPPSRAMPARLDNTSAATPDPQPSVTHTHTHTQTHRHTHTHQSAAAPTHLQRQQDTTQTHKHTNTYDNPV